MGAGRQGGLPVEGHRAGEHGTLGAKDQRRAVGGHSLYMMERVATGGLPDQENWHRGVLSPGAKHNGGPRVGLGLARPHGV